MGLAAKPITSVVLLPLLLSLFAAAATQVAAKLKTSNIQFDYFNDTYNLGAFHVDQPATIHNDALQVTLDSVNSAFLINHAGRILYNHPFKLWEGQNDTDRVASFNASFLVNLYRVDNSTPGEGLTFVVAPDLNLPPNSYGEYLGLTNSTTDGNKTNHLIAVELDTYKENFDPDSNHIGLNINSVKSNMTASLTPLEFQLVGEGTTANFFNVWVQYDGINKVIEVYIAQQANKTDPTPSRPNNPILKSSLDLRGVINQYSYVYGEYLGLTNSTTDADKANGLIAVELDTFKEYFDPDSNHIGLNINSVKSNMTASLTPLGFQLVGEGTTANFFNVWVQYDGINKVIEVYIAQQANKTDPTPSRPDNPILKSSLDLRGVINQYSYFGFSASTSNVTELNCVLRWNFTIEHYCDEKQNWGEIIGLAVGIPVVLVTLVALVHYCRKWMSSERLNRQITGEMKSMPGMPREYEFKDLQKATNNFHEKMKLGEGGFGVVYKGYLANENLEVAVKMFSREKLKGQEDFLKELIINRLKHKNLVQLRGWCHKHGDKLMLVFDYMPNGSLDKHLFSSDGDSQPLSWYRRNKIISGVASALHYLHNDHDDRVIHRDLKASNVMLDTEFNAKLGDFGLARALANEKNSYITAEGFCGTTGYIAPEYSLTGKATQQSDVYAFGAVLLEVVCGKRPWTQINGYLVDWVWALHRERRLLRAVDNRLGGDYKVEEVERVLLLGLACSHPTASARPKTQEIVQILSGSVDVLHVPRRKPAFGWSSPLMGVEDICPATGSGLTPQAIDPETQHHIIDMFNTI